jgi:hypothetical protein
MATTFASDDDVQITVKYDGPAIASGRMDARDLAPAMLATAKLLEHSAVLMYGSSATLKIDVQADFKGGSFAYEIITRLLDAGHLLYSNMSVSDVVITGSLLIRTLKMARGRAPKEIVTAPEPQIVFHDGDVITVNVHVAKLFLNPTVRADVEGAVEPLKRVGIDSFVLTTPDDVVGIVKDEVDYFSAPITDAKLLQDRTEPEIVEILSPHFKEGNKWQFALAGEGAFWARVLDEEFLEKVRSREIGIFSGDLYRVQMRVLVTRLPSGKPERVREIIRVDGKEAPGADAQRSLFE